MEQILSTLWSSLTDAGLKLLYAILILAVGLKLTNWFTKWLAKHERYSKLDDSLRSFLNSAISITLRILVFVTAALTLGIPTTSFITILTSAGVAIGLALQGSLSNLAGGLMILFFKPFKVGDFIETAGGMGTVRSITVFYTNIVTPDGRQIVLPNGSLTNSAITNCSVEPTRGSDLVFRVAYTADPAKVVDVLKEAARSCAFVLDDPAPNAWMSRQADGALEFTLRVRCLRENLLTVNSSLPALGKNALDAAGIAAPAPAYVLRETR